MIKYTVFMLIILRLQSAIGDGILESIGENPIAPVEVHDDDETDAVYTREVRTDLQTVIDCGLALSEPLKLDRVNANLATLKYKVKDAVITNISKCEIKNLKVDLESLELDVYLFCPYLISTGQIDIDGMILVLPIYGESEFRIDAENYYISLNTKLKKFTKKGITYLKIQTYTIKMDIIGPVVYKFKNLFYDNQVLASAAHTYINANWKPATELSQYPFCYSTMKNVCKNINKCLKGVPIDNLDL